MVLERAQFRITPGREDEFEQAFAQAKLLLAGSRGFLGATLSRGVESASTYLLLVEWETLEDHTEGFRGSAGYQRWRELLHGFYDPFPTVAHFREVLTATAEG